MARRRHRAGRDGRICGVGGQTETVDAMRESGEFGTAKYSPSSLFESGLEAVPLLLASCINGKHQQRGVVLPTAPAELAPGRENLGLQFVGGPRPALFDQTHQPT